MSAHPALDSIESFRSWAEEDYPGQIMSHPIFEVSPDVGGFLLYTGDTLVMTFVDTTNNPDGPWAIQVGAGLAHAIPDIDGPMDWANSRNRQAVLGRYYSAPARSHGISALAYTEALHSYYFGLLGEAPSMQSWLRLVFRTIVETANEEGPQVTATFGGKAFEPADADTTVLFTLLGS